MNNRKSVRGLILAAILFAPSTLFAQDAEIAFLEGMSAFRNDNHEEAINRFREVIRLDPTRAEAIELMNSSQDSLVQLMMAGGEFETFAMSVIEASRNADRELITDTDAAAEAAAACLEGSYADRSKAIWHLGQTFGPFGVAPLVANLGGNDDVHFAAIYALSRMGSDSLIPILAATSTSNADVRLALVQVLLQLNDARANALLAEMAVEDDDARIQQMAKVKGGDPASLHFAQANAYYRNDPAMGLSEVENYGVYWTMEGGSLVATEVPAPIVSLELARSHFERAASLGHSGAAAGLAAVHAAQASSYYSAGDAENAAAQENAALMLGASAIDSALLKSVKAGDLAVSMQLARLLDGAFRNNGAGLNAALNSDMPALRGAAAVALANDGNNSSAVVAALANCVQLEAVRTVVIVDSNSSRSSALAAELNSSTVTTFIANDGTDGLIELHRGYGVDAFVIADPLPEFYARRLVKEIRRDRNYSDSAILVIGNDGTGDIDGAEVADSLSAADVTASFADLDSDRSALLVAAQLSAEALARMAANGSGSAGEAGDALAGAVGRDDVVSIPAMKALANCGGSSHAASLVAVVADDSRSDAARTAAANAIAGIASRYSVTVDESALANAANSGNAELAKACARALGALASGAGAQ